MKRLLKVKPGGRGVGTTLPDGSGLYYPLVATYHPAMEEFYGTAIDTDDWITSNSSFGTGGASFAVASSFATMISSTATSGTSNIKMQSAGAAQLNAQVVGGLVTNNYSNAHIYSLPFRVKFFASLYCSAGSGVAPTGGYDVYMGIRNLADNQSQIPVAAETHIAQFHLDGSTAGGSSLASPVVETQVYAGSTAAGFIASAAFNPFNSSGSRTSTAVTGYVIEATHRGVWFSIQPDQTTQEQPMLIAHVGSPLIRHDLPYFIDVRQIANGTAGYTTTGANYVSVDQIVVEQIANQMKSSDDANRDYRIGSLRTYTSTSGLAPTAGNTLATSGAGVLYGMTVTTTSTGTTNLYVAAYDASAVGSNCYGFGFSAGSQTMSAQARLIFLQQVYAAVGSSGAGPASMVQPVIPAVGIPFFRGLVFGDVAVTGSAVGASALNTFVVYRSQ